MKRATIISIATVLLVVGCGGRTSNNGLPTPAQPEPGPALEPSQECVQLQASSAPTHWGPAGGGPIVKEMYPQLVAGANGRTMNDVWVRATDDVYAAGDGILRWNGCVWSVVREGWFESIWGSNERLWFAGARQKCAGACVGLVTELAGDVWTELPELGGVVTSVWAAGPENIWVSTLEPSATDQSLGPVPVIHRYDGTTWLRQFDSPMPGRHVIVGRDAAVFIGSEAGLQASNGENLRGGGCGNSRGRVGETLYSGHCRIDASGTISEIDLGVRWGSSESDMWGLRDGNVMRSNSFDTWPVDKGTSEPLRAVMGSAEHDVWAVGDEGTLVHFSP